MTEFTTQNAPAENVVVYAPNDDRRTELTLQLVRSLKDSGYRVYVYTNNHVSAFEEVVGSALVRRGLVVPVAHAREILHAHYTYRYRVAVVFFGLENSKQPMLAGAAADVVGTRNKTLNRLLRDTDIRVISVSSDAQVARDHRYSLRWEESKWVRCGDPKGFVLPDDDNTKAATNTDAAIDDNAVKSTWLQWLGVA